MVKVLVTNPRPPRFNAKDYNRLTPLCLVIEKCYTDLITLMLENGADKVVDPRDLISSTFNTQLQMTKVILDYYKKVYGESEINKILIFT